MKTILPVVLTAFVLVTLIGCDQQQVAGPDLQEELLPSPDARPAPTHSVAADVDPFADAVVTDGVNDQGQGFLDPAGTLGNLQTLDPAKSPPVTGLGAGGFVVLDMGVGEAIEDKQGFDFFVSESDGSLPAAGFGAPEPFIVGVSNSPTGPFVNLGTANGSAFFDLAGTGLKTARYVRIEDTGGGFPPSGADIQSVVAIHHEGADFRLTPTVVNRASGAPHVMSHVQAPHGFDVDEASLVLATAIDQPAPSPPPFFSSLSIPGALQGKGNVAKFDRAAFLAEAPDGDNIIVALKLTSASGEVLYLFDLVEVR